MRTTGISGFWIQLLSISNSFEIRQNAENGFEIKNLQNITLKLYLFVLKQVKNITIEAKLASIFL